MGDRTRILLATSLGHFVNDGFLVLFSILIVYYTRMGVDATVLGVLAAAISLLSGLLSTPIGSSADRRGNYGRLMILGLSLLVASSALYSLSFALPVLALPLVVISSALLGSGLAFYHQLGAAMLQLEYGDDAPKALGINGSLGSLGRALFPSILVFLIVSLGPSLGLLSVAAYNAAIILAIAAMLRRTRFGPRRIPGTGSPSADAPAPSKIRISAVMPLITLVFIRSIFFTGVLTYVPTYLVHLYHSDVLMGVVLTVSYATAVIGQPLFGRLTSRYGGLPMVILTTVVPTAAFLAFLYVSNELVSLTLFAVYSFFAMSGFPVLLGYVGQIVGRENLSRANALVWGVGNMVGGSIGALIGGPLMSIVGVVYLMWIYAAFGAISMIFIPSLSRWNANSSGH
ncbi:MAG: MFS transporter [Conexivisphaera sp.]